MAVAFGSIQTATLDPGETSIVITKPSGLAAGDLMIALLAVTGPNEAYTATGWDELFANNIPNFNFKMNCLVRVADSSDAAATNFTFNVNASGDSKVGALLRITGSSFSGLANMVSDTDDVAADTTPTYTGGVTPVGSTALLIMGCFAGGVGTSSTYAITNNNPSWTERADISVNDVEDISLSVATADYAFATATGDYSLSITDGTETGGYIIAVSESANVTVSPAVITTTATVQAPSVSGSANVSPAVITTTATLPAPTITTSDPEWTNQTKHSSSWTNQSKSWP